MAYEAVKVKKPLTLDPARPSVLTFFVVWELIVQFDVVPKTMLAAPTQVGERFIEKLTDPNPEGGTMGSRLGELQEAFTGYLLALAHWDAAGALHGLVLGRVEGIARPLFEMIRPYRRWRGFPLTIFWFGIGCRGKVFIIFLAGIVPCVINSFVGVRMTNPTLIQMART